MKQRAGVSATSEDMLLEGSFWREHALTQLIPYWYEHVRDKEYGGYYLNLDPRWQPCPPWEKMPAMLSRNVFGFSAAYLMSGEEKYLAAAKEGVDFLLEFAWDKEYGGWFDMLTRSGEPQQTTKSIAPQLYTNVGLTLYYLTTGDARGLAQVQQSIQIQQTHGHDKEFGGYYTALNRDLSVRDDSKHKHAHYGYVGSLLLNYWLTTRDPGILEWEKHLTDLSLERMRDAEQGWMHGYLWRLDRQWRPTPAVREGREVVAVGAQLTAALSFLRLYHQTGEAAYLEAGKTLGDKLNHRGWDEHKACWFDSIEKSPPHRPLLSLGVGWWLQIYGCFLQLQLYRLTGDPQCLERFRKGESFWDKYFVDREDGGVHASVSVDGEPLGNCHKAGGWRASYHEMEHALLNHLYLNLYVNNQPTTLHFRFEGSESPRKYFVSPVDDPAVQIRSVKVDDRPWPDFDGAERSISLPSGPAVKVQVTLSTK